MPSKSGSCDLLKKAGKKSESDIQITPSLFQQKKNSNEGTLCLQQIYLLLLILLNNSAILFSRVGFIFMYIKL